jgi:ribonuclease HI
LDAELLAVIIGLEEAASFSGFDRVFVFSDNQEALRYCRFSPKAGHLAYANVRFRSALSMLSLLEVVGVYIPAHCGHFGNETADRECKIPIPAPVLSEMSPLKSHSALAAQDSHLRNLA